MSSVEYTPYYRAETISDWVEQFKKFSVQNHLNLDICLLTDLPNWQKLVVNVMKD